MALTGRTAPGQTTSANRRAFDVLRYSIIETISWSTSVTTRLLPSRRPEASSRWNSSTALFLVPGTRVTLPEMPSAS